MLSPLKAADPLPGLLKKETIKKTNIMKTIYQSVLVLSVISYLSSGAILRAETSFNLIDGEPIRTQDQGIADDRVTAVTITGSERPGKFPTVSVPPSGPRTPRSKSASPGKSKSA